eukprot:7390544-Prymnesium_polylepis.1
MYHIDLLRTSHAQDMRYAASWRGRPGCNSGCAGSRCRLLCTPPSSVVLCSLSASSFAERPMSSKLLCIEPSSPVTVDAQWAASSRKPRCNGTAAATQKRRCQPHPGRRASSLCAPAELSGRADQGRRPTLRQPRILPSLRNAGQVSRSALTSWRGRDARTECCSQALQRHATKPNFHAARNS